MSTELPDPSTSHPPSAHKSLWVCLHFYQLALDIFGRNQTSAYDKPVVITEKRRVYQCNQAAATLGIQIGQSMDTAFTLSDQVTTIERQPDKEISALQHLAQWAYQFTPNVAIKSNDCLVLEVSSSLKLFRGLTNLSQQIKEGAKSQGYCLAFATADTPLAATVMAKSKAQNATLESTPIHYLETDNKVIDGLQQMGIQNLEQLLALPISGIKRRFGTYFGDYLLRLTGAKADPQKYISETAKFHHSITFMQDVDNLSALTFPINRLLGELSEFLTRRQLWIQQLSWHLCHRAHPERRALSVHLAAPTNNIKMFLALTQLKLDQIKDIKEIDSIALSVNRFFPAGQPSSDLFAGRGFNYATVTDTNTEQQNQLLNMLHAKLGQDACFGIAEDNDHRPEKAWRKVEPGSKQSSNIKMPALTNTPIETNARPGFLLPTPKALRTVGGEPYLGGKLTLVKGPERIDFGWWDQPLGKPLTRDYYVARQQQGGLLWVFKYLAAERWYLHGIFS